MSIESSTIRMSGSEGKPKKQEKSQEELRAILDRKLKDMRPVLRDGIEEYEQALIEGLFEDVGDEPAGAGDIRKESMQNKLSALFDRAELMKSKIDGKDALPQAQEELSAEYTPHPDGKKETITLNIEAKLQEFASLYQETNVDLPPDFEDTVLELWDKHQTAIEQAMEQNGFDDILVIPGTVSLTELKDNMSMEDGYYEYDNFKNGGSFAGAVSDHADKTRLVLVHKAQNLQDRPELKKTLNTKGKDVQLDQALTLEDYLVFQRKYFKETQKHLDEIGWTWLATKSGARLVGAYWRSDRRGLGVDASDLETLHVSLGVRPARCFS